MISAAQDINVKIRNTKVTIPSALNSAGINAVLNNSRIVDIIPAPP